ncbi:hypothetical protein PRZ48_014151 [Zasmidium cellare]|uniref:Uncharacterized protein n=1 Tax=Zasmidium cellare TaxID=395010 RepID=A0ABR0E065_ZASCE|nr:hypothetical protein PRZ48_014151 [Zasmidium cellare]
MEDFNARMHNLPVEIFDTIRDLALSDKLEAPTDTYICINRNYRPPLALHITSAVRKNFAYAYYTRNTFTYAEDLIGLFVKFLKSLPPFHRRCIRKIRVVRFGELWAALDGYAERAALATLKKLKRAYGSGKEIMHESDTVLSTVITNRRVEGPQLEKMQRSNFQGRFLAGRDG